MIGTAMLCLALNVYHEARDQPLEGQKAVAAVTMNRAGDDPHKVCRVVFAPAQFSWTNSIPGEKPLRKRNYALAHLPDQEDVAWKKAIMVARSAMLQKIKFPKSVTHYHTKQVAPKWASSKQFQLVAVIGDHKFYKHS